MHYTNLVHVQQKGRISAKIKNQTWNGERSFCHVCRHYTEPVARRRLFENSSLPFGTEQRVERKNPKRTRQLGETFVELFLVFVVVVEIKVVAEIVRFVGLGVVTARQDAVLKFSRKLKFFNRLHFSRFD